VPNLEFCLWLWTLGCIAMGAAGIYRIRAHVGRWRQASGHGLGLFAFFLLLAGMAVATMYRPDGLAPQGVAAGLLLAGMLWEHPSAATVEEK
jgi:hypothetical protein